MLTKVQQIERDILYAAQWGPVDTAASHPVDDYLSERYAGDDWEQVVHGVKWCISQGYITSADGWIGVRTDSGDSRLAELDHPRMAQFKKLSVPLYVPIVSAIVGGVSGGIAGAMAGRLF